MNKKVINQWYKYQDCFKDYMKNTDMKEYREWNDFIKMVIKYALPSYYLIDYKEVGSYQGDIYFKIEDKNKNVYSGEMSYGSCSFCDSLLAIFSYGDGLPSNRQVEDAMLLALEMIESIKIEKRGGE